MEPRILTHMPSAANEYLAELRDAGIQQDRARFRWNLERMGIALGMEISREMTYSKQTVQTPLGEARIDRLDTQPVLATVLRAGIPMHAGMAQVFDRADQAFVSACRHYETDDHTAFSIRIDAVSSPSLEGRVLIIADPMLATGASLVEVLQALMKSHGQPAALHIAAVIASEEGIAHVAEQLPDARIWVGAVDAVLSEKGYIIPGLGDAGDLAFGPKIN